MKFKHYITFKDSIERILKENLGDGLVLDGDVEVETDRRFNVGRVYPKKEGYYFTMKKDYKDLYAVNEFYEYDLEFNESLVKCIRNIRESCPKELKIISISNKIQEVYTMQGQRFVDYILRIHFDDTYHYALKTISESLRNDRT